MQNGRLNEIGSHWYIQPFNREAPELPISLTMKAASSWVSSGLRFTSTRTTPTTLRPIF